MGRAFGWLILRHLFISGNIVNLSVILNDRAAETESRLQPSLARKQIIELLSLSRPRNIIHPKSNPLLEKRRAGQRDESDWLRQKIDP